MTKAFCLLICNNALYLCYVWSKFDGNWLKMSFRDHFSRPKLGVKRVKRGGGGGGGGGGHPDIIYPSMNVSKS